MDAMFKALALVGDIWVMWILLGASIVALGIMIERGWCYSQDKLNFPEFLEELRRYLEVGDLSSAKQMFHSYRGIEARVASAGLSHLSRGTVAVEEAMMSQLVIERSLLEKNLIVLGTLGNNAPFVGLLGTVLGIIKVFNDLAVSGSAGISVAMAGISSALIATALGIFVAIPSVAANNYFHTRIRRMLANAQSLIHLIQVHLRDETLHRASYPVEPELNFSQDRSGR